MAAAATDVTGKDIDDILDEIEENEEKTQKTSGTNPKETENAGANWKEILSQLQNGNSNFVKSLITSKDIDINEKDPANGKTVLIYVTIIGNYDLVKLVCNFGANVNIKDDSKCDALDYAQRYGRYAITELLFYRQLSGSLGNDLKEIATNIYDKNEEAKRLKANDKQGYDGGEHSIRISNNIMKAMINAIKNRDPFSPDLLYYAWYFYQEACAKKKQEPLTTEFPQEDEKVDNGFYSSRGEEEEAARKRRDKNDAHLLTLWKVMMTAYEEILCDTSDKEGWEWLKKYFINSLIWFLPHPTNKNKANDDDADDMEAILSTTLFYELLTRVRKESKAQSDLLLKEKIDKIKNETPQEWKTLLLYDVTTEFAKNARQDVCGCIKPKYTKQQLNEEMYPPSTHFSARKHYDTNIYLNELLFRANIMDTMFQFDMKQITKEINSIAGFDSKYRAGPVKTLARSQTKVENDYIAEEYPTSAKILDINRCAIQFKTIQQMMKYLQLFTERINKKQTHSIVAIIRCKNGWSVYNPQQPSYTDVKLNVLVQSPNDGTVVAEIQLLLQLMSAFKKKAHKLYSVERKFELVYNFNKLQNKMSAFKDIFGAENIMIDIFRRNELESFKSYWMVIYNEHNLRLSIDALVPSSMEEKSNPWNVPLFYLLMKDDSDIYNYLQQHHSNILCKALQTYLKMCYGKRGFSAFLDDMYKKCERNKDAIMTQDELILQFIQKVYAFGSVNEEVQSETFRTLFDIKDEANKTFIQAISMRTKCPNSFQYIVDDTRITNEDKMKLFGADTKGLLSALKNKYLDHISAILFYLNARKDKPALLNVLNWKPKKGSSKNGFLWICSTKDDQRSLLPFIINNPMIDRDEMCKLVSLQDDTIYTAIELASISSAVNMQLLLNYFYKKDNVLKMFSEDIADDWKKKIKFKTEAILALLKHLANDKDKLVKLLVKFGLFAVIMQLNKVQALEYILYKTCLTQSDIFALIDKKCPLDYPYDHPVPEKLCATELIRYFKDDLRLLTQILDLTCEHRSLFTLLYCKWKSNQTRHILFNDSAVSVDQMCAYLKRNEIGAYVKNRDHDNASGIKKESTFFKLVEGYHGGINTTDLLKYVPQQTFVDMLLQKHSTTKEPYMKSTKLDRKDVLLTIFTQIKDTQLIARLLENMNTSVKAQIEIAEQFKVYVAFCDKYTESKDVSDEKVDESMFKDIDIENHPLGTAFICGNIEIIELFLKRYNWDKDGKLLFNLLNDPKLIKNLFCNVNDNESTIKILRMLILDNERLSEAQKFDLISARTKPFDDMSKNYSIVITPALVETNNVLRLCVLRYFEAKGQKEYILKSLQDEIPWIDNRGATKLKIVAPMYPICGRYKNNVPPVEFIINCALLSADEKVKLLENVFVYIIKLNKGLSLNVLRFIGDDEKLLMRFLSQKDDKTKESALMLMMKMKASKDSESLLYLLDNKALSYEYKRKLVFEDVYTFDEKEHNSSTYWGYGPYQHVFALSCKQYHGTKYIEKICEYFDLEKDGNFEKTDDILIKAETTNHLKVILNNIKDNKLAKRLFAVKSADLNKWGATVLEVCQYHGPKNRFSSDDVEDEQIQIQRKFNMLHKYQDYLALDESLDDEKGSEINITFEEYAKYWTNPWMTCCEFGKMETMMKLIQYVVQRDDDKYTKLTGLFTNNYDLLSGNNCMMTLNECGSNEMIIKILQHLESMLKDKFTDILVNILMTKNKVTNKTLLMIVSENDDNYTLVDSLLNMVKDKKRIQDVLNSKDDSQNTCLYYAKEKIKNLMHKYLK